jgi:multiple sugar transport system substrate-binding protein
MTKCLIRNGSPARFLHSLSGDPEVPRASPAMDVVDNLQRRGSLQVWPRPPIPFITSLMRIVGQEVHAVIWDGAPAKDVLVRIENQLKPMFDSLSAEIKTMKIKS